VVLVERLPGKLMHSESHTKPSKWRYISGKILLGKKNYRNKLLEDLLPFIAYIKNADDK
jgi:hypothetical protein